MYRIENLVYLLLVGLRVLGDLFLREMLPRLGLARGIADHAGEIADQKGHLVAQFLELAHLVQEHGVTKVNVRRRGIETRLDAQRLSRRDRPLQFLRAGPPRQ